MCSFTPTVITVDAIFSSSAWGLKVVKLFSFSALKFNFHRETGVEWAYTEWKRLIYHPLIVNEKFLETSMWVRF